MRWLPLLLVSSVALAEPPPPEVRTSDVKATLPAVPRFDAIAETPRALRLVTRPWNKLVVVHGYVIATSRDMLWLGDTKTESQESALWVVDYAPVAAVAVGDYVTVFGSFSDLSLHHQSNRDGLVMFEKLEKAVPLANPKRLAAEDETEPTPPPLPVPTARPLAPGDKAEAEQLMRDANGFLGMRQPEKAIAKYKRVLELWPDNDLAHYGFGGALMIQHDWAAARDQFEAAAKLRPDAAMYQMWLGASRYESGQTAEAREPLVRAHQLGPKMWRTPYYLGRLARDAFHPRAAATYFTEAITSFSREHAPYIALAELYRRWGHYPEAVAVADEGLRNCIDGHNELGFALGRAYEDAGQRDKAIAALTIAVDLGNGHALLERGRVKRAKGDRAGAKRDFAQVVEKAKDDAPLAQLAEQALAELK